MPELLPCPFCGGEAALKHMVSCHILIKMDVIEYYVSHDSADCPVGCIETGFYDTKQEAIAAWNTRHEKTDKRTKKTCESLEIELEVELVD